MNERIAGIIGNIHELEKQLELEFAKRRMELSFTVTGRVVKFEEHVLKRQRELKMRLSHYILGARPLMLITAPVIYSLILPFMLLDLFVTAYQWVCFPVYGMPLVRRSDYLVIDRGHLAYLNVIEKINCMYCGYGNGVIAYVREVASMTEQYWCPIKHARRVIATHDRYRQFVDYGDAENYRTELEVLRAQVRQKRDDLS
jgi:hypothetical protein